MNYSARFRQNDGGIWRFFLCTGFASDFLFPSKAAAATWARKCFIEGTAELEAMQAILRD